MADLGMNFQADQYEAPSFDPVPKGEYVVNIIDSDVAVNSKNTGKNLKLTLEIIDGQFKGRKIFESLSFQNPNETAERIARGMISAICHAIGLTHLTDTQHLHNKPFLGKIKISKGQDGYDDSNSLAGAKALGQGQNQAQQNFGGQNAQNNQNGFNNQSSNGGFNGSNAGGYGQYGSSQAQNQGFGSNQSFNQNANQNQNGNGFNQNSNGQNQQPQNQGFNQGGQAQVNPNQGFNQEFNQNGNGQHQFVDNSQVPDMNFNQNSQGQNQNAGQAQGNGEKPPWEQ